MKMPSFDDSKRVRYFFSLSLIRASVRFRSVMSDQGTDDVSGGSRSGSLKEHVRRFPFFLTNERVLDDAVPEKCVAVLGILEALV
jgi:hypothetical protein